MSLQIVTFSAVPYEMSIGELLGWIMGISFTLAVFICYSAETPERRSTFKMNPQRIKMFYNYKFKFNKNDK